MLSNKKVQFVMQIICRQSTLASSNNILPETEQNEKQTVVNPTSNLINNGQFYSSVKLKDTVNSTEIPRMNNSSRDINLELLLNNNQNHHMKKKAKIRDSLPGIINGFG